MHKPMNTTILLVEDDPGHARLIEKNLRRAGLSNDIIKFDNGEKVINYLFTEHPEASTERSAMLMLLDLNMPVMDGCQVLEKIKSEADTKNMPIIVLTTTDDPREIEKCYALGCNVFISKPVDYEKFSQAVKQLGLLINVMSAPEVPTDAEHIIP